MKTRILVTGGAGYIGSILVPLLLKEGCRVTVIDKFMYGQVSLADYCRDRKLEIIRGDARDSRLIKENLRSADYILPLACLTGAPVCDKNPEDARTVNLEAVKSLLKLRGRGQRILFPTTNSGYGIGQRERACDEKSPLRPVSLYGRLKVEAERRVLDSGNSVTLRLATVFGMSPRMRLDLLVNDFTYRALFDRYVVLFEPDFIRNYVHVADAANAFLHTIRHFEKMKGEPYNVGRSDCNISKRALCEEIKRQIPDFHIAVSFHGKDPDQRNYIVSNQKMESTGFKAKVSLSEGISELIKGYQIIRRNQFVNA